MYQAIQPVFNVQLVGAMQEVGLLDVMRYHPDPIVGMAQFVNVMLDIIVQVKLPIKQHVHQEHFFHTRTAVQ
jgi:hypothetical protein